MNIPTPKPKTPFNKIRLRTTLVVPFVVQLIAAIGLVGWLSFLNGQRAVKDLSSQLRQELTARIQQELKAYLNNPHAINQLNVDAFTQGELNVNATSAPRFFHETKISPLTYAIYCAGEDGQFLGTTRSPEDGTFMLMTNNPSTDRQLQFYGLDKQGNRTNLLQTLGNYDPRSRPWYKAAVAAKQPVWSDIYLDFVVLLPTLTASQPVYSASNNLVGVCATDVLLTDDLRKFLANLSIGKTGEAFVIDRTGAVISSSTDEALTVGEGEEAKLLQATDSSNALVSGTANYLKQNFGELSNIQQPQQLDFLLDGKRQFVQVLPYDDGRGLNWLIVVAVPEADFMEQINRNTRNTIYLCLVSLATAIAIGAATARWITRPIQRVSKAVEEVSKGNLDQAVEPSSIAEINTLSASFNSMAGQLKESFDALQVAEENYRGIFENALEGIFQSVPGGRFISANPAMARIYGYDSPADMIASITNAGEQLYVNPGDRDEFRRLMQEQGYVQDFEFQSYRKDKSIMWIQIGARAVKDSNGQVRYYEGIVQDITAQKRQKEILETKVAERTEDLAKANAAISDLNERLQSENLRMGAELSVVRKLQQMVLPKEEELNQITELDIAGFMQPADEVGGDYYDVLRRDGLVKIGIGDVTGHGLESGMLMLMTQTAIRTLLEHQEVDSTRFFSTVNRVIYDNANRMDCSKNLTLSLLDYRNGTINVSGCHEDVIVIRSTGEVERIDTIALGLPLGLEADISAFIAEVNIQLYSNDVVVLYTDGITEAINEQRQQYGVERLCTVVAQHRSGSANDIRHAVIDDVQHHIGGQTIRDDITLLILKQR